MCDNRSDTSVLESKTSTADETDDMQVMKEDRGGIAHTERREIT